MSSGPQPAKGAPPAHVVAQIPLDLASATCHMGHAWRHVVAVIYDEEPGVWARLQDVAVETRDDQDVIVCVRCRLLSIAPRRR